MYASSRRAFLQRTSLAVPAAALVAAHTAGTDQTPTHSLGPRIIEPGPHYSRAVVHGGTVYVSGVLGVKPGTRDLVSADFEPQCRQVLENLRASVEAAGTSMGRVVKCTCFLTDAADFAAFNRVYATFFPSNPPARSTVIVKALVLEGAKVEVDCFAAVG